MEFESLKSLGYLGVLSSLSASVYVVYGQSGGSPAVARAALGILPVLIYVFCRLSEGRDGELVIRGKTLNRKSVITGSLIPAAGAGFGVPVSVLGVRDLGLAAKLVTGFALGVAMFPVDLLLARPYGIKVEEVVRDMFSASKN